MNADVAATPDGSLRFIARVDPPTGEDRLIAVDLKRRTTLWTATLQNRVKYNLDDGTATLAVSPEGRLLYVYSCSTTPSGTSATLILTCFGSGDSGLRPRDRS